MIRPWRKLSSKPLGDYRIFSLREERRESPRTGKEHGFFIIDSPCWVNVVALTPDRQMILIEQYRHGSNTVELEIPGGMMEASDASPEAAGGRELTEETGYQGDQPVLIGEVFPNPAIQTNRCFTVLALNCRPMGRRRRPPDPADADGAGAGIGGVGADTARAGGGGAVSL